MAVCRENKRGWMFFPPRTEPTTFHSLFPMFSVIFPAFSDIFRSPLASDASFDVKTRCFEYPPTRDHFSFLYPGPFSMSIPFMIEPSAAYEILDAAYDLTNGKRGELQGGLVLELISNRRQQSGDDEMTQSAFWRAIATLDRNGYLKHERRGAVRLQDHELDLRRSQILNMLNGWYRGDLRRLFACLMIIVGKEDIRRALAEIAALSRLIKKNSDGKETLITEGLHRMAPFALEF